MRQISNAVYLRISNASYNTVSQIKHTGFQLWLRKSVIEKRYRPYLNRFINTLTTQIVCVFLDLHLIKVSTGYKIYLVLECTVIICLLVDILGCTIKKCNMLNEIKLTHLNPSLQNSKFFFEYSHICSGFVWFSFHRWNINEVLVPARQLSPHGVNSRSFGWHGLNSELSTMK